MAEIYLSVADETRTEKIIEKSRFITTSRRVQSEEEAKNFITKVAKQYSDATHNCYAYICDKAGNFLRFSDDGEPSGTAGMPILEVIKAKNLKEVAVVVTRYFGGIKLGAGGLVRAYGGCVAENLDCADVVKFEPCREIKITVGYSLSDAAVKFCRERNAKLFNTDYADSVALTVAVKKSEEDNFFKELINKLNGKVEVEKVREYYISFKI